jgi:predicted PurR-regulated permease PerM
VGETDTSAKQVALSDGSTNGLRTPPPAPEPPLIRVRLDVPVWLILKVVAVLVALFILQTLTVVIIEIFVALLIAAALDPVVTWLQRHHWPRSLSVAVLILAFLGLIAGAGIIFVPPVVQEVQQIAKNLPDYVEEGRRILRHYPTLYQRINDAASKGSADPNAIASQALTLGTGILTVGTNIILTLTLAAYLLVDGEQIFNTLSTFIPVRYRIKVRQTFPEVSRVVRGYIVGQTITSTLVGVYSWIVLASLDVPQGLLLALLAAIADAIPIFGPFIGTVPPVLIALTVSWPKAAAVLVLYLIYQQIEAGYIIPRVYGNRLRISSFAVLVAILIGAQLLGIVGAFLALPIAAALPTIAKIWRESEDGPVDPPTPAPPTVGLPDPEEPAPAVTPAGY